MSPSKLLNKNNRLKPWTTFGLTIVLLAAGSTASAFDSPKLDVSTIELFEKEVRPVLVKQCVSCHGPAQQFSSLRVDSREALLKGGNRGPAIVPGDPRLSLISQAIRHEGI